MRCMSTRPFQKSSILLGSFVVSPIALHNSLVYFVFVGHCRCWIRNPRQLCYETWWWSTLQPQEVLLARMTFGGVKSVCVFVYKTEGHATQPHIMEQTCRSPENARMLCGVFLVSSFSGRLANWRRRLNDRRTAIDVKSRIEDLRRL